jgi:hypothetical protein
MGDRIPGAAPLRKFDKNTMTFNSGWDRRCTPLPDVDDVRDIQRTLIQRGFTLTTKADESTTGPASLMLLDSDGDPILVDQHVAKPKYQEKWRASQRQSVRNVFLPSPGFLGEGIGVRVRNVALILGCHAHRFG